MDVTKKSIYMTRAMRRAKRKFMGLPGFMDEVRMYMAADRLQKLIDKEQLTYEQYMSMIEVHDEKLPAVENVWSKRRKANAKKTKNNRR